MRLEMGMSHKLQMQQKLVLAPQIIQSIEILQFPSMNLLDYIAMDVKAPLENYANLVGRRIDPELIRTSVWVIKQSGVPHEFKTTVVPGLHTTRELKAISELIHGADRYVVQDFISTNPLRGELHPQKPCLESSAEAVSGERNLSKSSSLSRRWILKASHRDNGSVFSQSNGMKRARAAFQ